MSGAGVTYTLEGRTGLIRLDDGRANSLSPAVIEALEAALDRAEPEAGAVLLLGREGRFCAGFDLTTMRQGPEAAGALVMAGARLLLRMCELPLPIVAGCTGHAIAAGALLLLASDLRLGAAGSFKIGLSEVAIGMTLPGFALELARERLSKRHFYRAATQARIYDPAGALEAGYLDGVEAPDALEAAARVEAERLAGLDRAAFRNTKRRAAAPLLARVRADLEADVGRLTGAQKR